MNKKIMIYNNNNNEKILYNKLFNNFLYKNGYLKYLLNIINRSCYIKINNNSIFI